ncbi:MAG: type I secretion system permease/ATPase [Proteobacteria bacterium]|nr:type I secretion system permease/ATPase [Desulfobacula sp.]MBU3952186.1 type I secretion system permease/ATPase [Pseudomonadota bacterium]MBU4132601.1 type I secretion system permease/ATPase [Pseudomonadota bacterium]
MIQFLKSCRKYFAYAGLFSLFLNTLALTFSIYMLAVYDKVLSSGSMATLSVITLIALLALGSKGCLEYCRSVLLIRAGIKIDALLTPKVLTDMLKDLGRAESMNYSTGLKDINTLRNYLGANSIFAFFDVPWIFIYLGIIFLVHPVLGMTATAGAIVILVLGLLQDRLTRKKLAMAEKYNSQGRQWLLTSFRTAPELQSMAMIQNAGKGFCRVHDKELLSKNQAGTKSHLLSAVSQSFGALMQVIIFGAGAALVVGNKADPGVIIAASIIMGLALAPVNQGIGAWKQTSDAKTAYTNLKKLLQAHENEKSIAIETLTAALQVDNAGIKIKDARILKGINFELNPGEIMGLVGPNGAGKTCLCRMILGMWAPSSGQVTLDGHNVFDLDNESKARFFGYLPQNVELFAGTVRDNIARMGTVDDDKVIEAAKKAGAHDVITKFPLGYDTDIGEAGQSLSGGQRQRVGLARAIYGNPRLVILDEPNSNLDEAGEHALAGTMQQLKEMGATTIIITHKPSLLSCADKILVMEKGEMKRFGNKNEVFKQLMQPE